MEMSPEAASEAKKQVDILIRGRRGMLTIILILILTLNEGLKGIHGRNRVARAEVALPTLTLTLLPPPSRAPPP